MLRFALLLALLVASSCGPAPPPPEEEKPATPAVNIRDETHRFGKTGLVEAKVVAEQLGGKEFMPGGNFAAYEQDGKTYQVFFTLRRNAEQAMFLAMDYRDVLIDYRYVPHFGGFFGLDGDTPVLVFPKDKYMVAVTGLQLKDADEAGRLIAGYLN